LRGVFEAASATLTVGMKVSPPSKDIDAYTPCAFPAFPSYAATITSPRDATEASRATILKEDTWKLFSQPTGFVETMAF
jgi:hypothetical protein